MSGETTSAIILIMIAAYFLISSLLSDYKGSKTKSSNVLNEIKKQNEQLLSELKKLKQEKDINK